MEGIALEKLPCSPYLLQVINLSPHFNFLAMLGFGFAFTKVQTHCTWLQKCHYNLGTPINHKVRGKCQGKT
jgi:hypothetical protein